MVAGVIVGIVALPLAMAFAIASVARPEQGLYTAIIGGGIVTLFGGSRVQIAGPTGAFVVILAGVTAEFGIAGLQLATLMAGFILVLMGCLRMGSVIKFIPVPVIVGFTAGIGVIIFVGQWRDFLGLPSAEGESFYQRLPSLLGLMPQANPNTVLLGVLSLLLIHFGPRIRGLHKIPGPLLALVAITSVQAIFKLTGVATIGSAFGGLPAGLPALELPEFEFEKMQALIGPAFTIALLGAIESLLSAVVADGMANTRHDSNQELLGQGIANMVAPLFGGFAATGAIARTATNIRNGANSPLCVLAAILFVVAWNMSEPHRFIAVLKTAPTADRAIMVITFLLTIFTDLVVAVNVGVLLAILQFLRRMTESVETLAVEPDSLQRELAESGITQLPDKVLVFETAGPLFFAAAENLEQVLLQTSTDPAVIILRLRQVPFLDITAIQALERVVHKLRDRNVDVVLCEANPRVLAKLQKAGILHSQFRCRYANGLAEAIACSM